MSETGPYEDMRALAHRLLDAAQDGRADEVARLYGPDAVVWHNTDGKAISPADNAPIYAAFAAKVVTRRYEGVTITAFDGGWVLQHRLTGETDDGRSFNLPACAIVQVRAGRISRIDEYFDSAPFADLGLRTWLPDKAGHKTDKE